MLKKKELHCKNSYIKDKSMEIISAINRLWRLVLINPPTPMSDYEPILYPKEKRDTD